VRVQSLTTSVVLFGAGTLVGAGATWLIMSVLSRDETARRSTTPSEVHTADGRESTTSRQRCSDQLRGILADLEVRLMDAVDELVARFSVTAARDVGEQTSKSHRKPSSSSPLSPESTSFRPIPQCV